MIRRNYVHHLVAPTQMQSAIRTDGGQRDTLIAENLACAANVDANIEANRVSNGQLFSPERARN